MRTFAKLFAKSPFAPLQKHMQDVDGCVLKVKEIFEALAKLDKKNIHDFVCDKIKHPRIVQREKQKSLV